MYIVERVYTHSLFIHSKKSMHTVEPAKKRTHLDRPPDLKISPIFVLRPFMKSFRCELCAWGTLNMSGDVEKNASVFLVYTSHWILSISGRLSLLRPGYETKNIHGCAIR